MVTEWLTALRTKPRWWYCYAASTALLIAGVAISHPPRYGLASTGLFALAMAVAAAGLLSAIAPILLIIWRSPLGRPLLALSHVLVGFIAAMQARPLVSRALQLPAHDFDLTVAILALLFYVPMWLAFAAMLTAALGILSVVTAFLASLVMPLLSVFISASSTWVAHGRRALVHGFAALALAMSFGFLSDLAQANSTTLSPVARLIAYAVDYHEAAAYPGIPAGAKVRLHENGVVSIARRVGLTVTIEVTTVKLPEQSRSEPTG